jgi:uncharacterized protein (TIGR03083 family)
MDVTPEVLEDLVGAYALDACDADETAALDEYLATDERAAVEVERLREAAAALAIVGARRPPVELRDRLLGAAADRVTPLSAGDTLRSETARFDALLETLDADSLGIVTDNGLTVHDLVRHVEAVDNAFVEEAGAPHRPFIGPEDMEEITSSRLRAVGDESFDESLARFRATRAELIAIGDRVEPERRLGGHGRDDTMLIRAFETWTHDDDIRRATGRDQVVPEPAAMRAMAELSMRLLPLALGIHGTPRPDRTARVVLTGPGGGEWTVTCAAGDVPHDGVDVVITASVVDWCRRFADRLPAADVPAAIDGDEALGRELLEAASVFAGL